MRAIARLSEKSTTVRVKPFLVPSWLRSGFRLVGAVAPGLAASAAQRLFFTPARAPRRTEQRATLARGRHFELATPVGPVAGWSWGQGAPVLLVHGWGGHAGQLTPFVARIVERGRRAIALDLPGHGDSAGRQSSIRHFESALLAAAAHFGPFDGVVAHSFGAPSTAVALDGGLVARRLVFLSPPSRFESFFERLVAGLGLDETTAWRFRLRGEAFVGRRFDELEARRLARHQDAPLLVIHDRFDDEVAFTEGAELARCWPGARLEATEGLGHYRILRDEGVSARAVDFLLPRSAAALEPEVAELAAAG